MEQERVTTKNGSTLRTHILAIYKDGILGMKSDTSASLAVQQVVSINFPELSPYNHPDSVQSIMLEPTLERFIDRLGGAYIDLWADNHSLEQDMKTILTYQTQNYSHTSAAKEAVQRISCAAAYSNMPETYHRYAETWANCFANFIIVSVNNRQSEELDYRIFLKAELIANVEQCTLGNLSVIGPITQAIVSKFNRLLKIGRSGVSAIRHHIDALTSAYQELWSNRYNRQQDMISVATTQEFNSTIRTQIQRIACAALHVHFKKTHNFDQALRWAGLYAKFLIQETQSK